MVAITRVLRTTEVARIATVASAVDDEIEGTNDSTVVLAMLVALAVTVVTAVVMVLVVGGVVLALVVGRVGPVVTAAARSTSNQTAMSE